MSSAAHAVQITFTNWQGKTDTDIVQWDFTVEEVTGGWKFSVSTDGSNPNADILLIGFNALNLGTFDVTAASSPSIADKGFTGADITRVCAATGGLSECGTGGGFATGNLFDVIVRVGGTGDDGLTSTMFTVATNVALSCGAFNLGDGTVGAYVGVRAQETSGNENSAKNWSATCNDTPPSVPEPAGIALLGVGLLGLGLARRRRAA